MAGIYIHIPFCKRKCIYCNFYSVASSAHVETFLYLLLKEIELQKNYLEKEKVKTIYFGGGSPSMLSGSFITETIEHIHENFNISANPEITLETNPDDVTGEKLKKWDSASVNRISIGVQSFHDPDLQFLKRIHNASQAEAAIKRSQDAGFENISIDLIYGIHRQTEKTWKENIFKSIAFRVPHISAYCLTAEEKTVLFNKIRSEKIKPLDEEQAVSQFRILMNEMMANKYLHYEISNFCLDGFFSKHNNAYWKGVKYLGLGPSAHSYNGKSRQWNSADLIEYLKRINKNKISAETEILTTSDKLNEYIMTSLRTMWGCDLAYVEKNFGFLERKRITDLLKPLQDKGHLEIKKESIFLTDEGKLFADRIASGLFVEKQ